MPGGTPGSHGAGVAGWRAWAGSAASNWTTSSSPGPGCCCVRGAPTTPARSHAACQDPAQYPYLPLPQPYTARAGRRTSSGPGTRARAAGRDLGCAVVERDRAGGGLGAPAAAATEAEVGYWVAPGERGARLRRRGAAGPGRVGLRARRAAGRGGLRRAQPASVRTALRAGFGYEGLARGAYQGGGTDGVPEQRGDDAVFARLAGDPGAPVPHAFPPLPPGGLSDGVIRLRVADRRRRRGTPRSPRTRCPSSGASPAPAERGRVARLRLARPACSWLVGPMAALTIDDAATGRYAGSCSCDAAGPPQVGGIGYVGAPVVPRPRYTDAGAAADRAVGLRARPTSPGSNSAPRSATSPRSGPRSPAGFEPDGVPPTPAAQPRRHASATRRASSPSTPATAERYAAAHALGQPSRIRP